MIYQEYEAFKQKYNEAQRIFNDALLEKEKLFTMTQPNAIRYDTDKVQVTPSGSILDNYVIALEESKIDEKLDTFRQLLKDRKFLLDMKEDELRLSNNRFDRVYVMKFLDNQNIGQIAKRMNYSRRQAYRIYDEVRKDLRG